MLDFPGPEIKSMSPALTDRSLTIGPQGKSPSLPFYYSYFFLYHEDIYFIFKTVSNLNILVILAVRRKRGKDIITNILQFSSVAQSSPTLCDPMNHSTPGLPLHHQLPEFTQTHAQRVGDVIQPSHPLSVVPSPPAPNPSKHQSLFQWVNSLHEVAKVLEFQLQHQSFQWTPRTDLL